MADRENAKFWPSFISALVLLLVVRSFVIDQFEGVHYRSVTPFYHLLIIPIFLSTWFARRYFVSLFFTFVYVGIHAYSIWLRVQVCFLGMDICPPTPLYTRLLDRLDVIDHIVSVALIALSVWYLRVLIRMRKQRRIV